MTIFLDNNIKTVFYHLLVILLKKFHCGAETYLLFEKQN